MARMIDRYFSSDDLDRITEAVEQAESRSDGEIAVVLTPHSRPWYKDTMLIAAGIGLVVTLVTLAVTREDRWGPYYAFTQAALLGVIAFVCAYALAAWLWRRGRAQSRWVWRKALSSFSALRPTRARTGVLIFVSMAECEAAIIADRGIAAKLPGAYWEGPCRVITDSVRTGCPTDGIIEAITDIGAQLAPHFPRSDDDTDELPDRPQVV